MPSRACGPGHPRCHATPPAALRTVRALTAAAAPLAHTPFAPAARRPPDRHPAQPPALRRRRRPALTRRRQAARHHRPPGRPRGHLGLQMGRHQDDQRRRKGRDRRGPAAKRHARRPALPDRLRPRARPVHLRADGGGQLPDHQRQRRQPRAAAGQLGQDHGARGAAGRARR
ncbi:MAG: hypothetical protein J3K34DRAFT_250779 [Monoraphidium minutum]|nr:MAG: hypothetical protein J3K34DRAFT_250779 [Monoraphidium minutum]